MNNFSKIGALFLGAVPFVLGAQDPPPITSTGPAVNCLPNEICNPLKAQSITDFLRSVLEVLLIFAVPLIIFFIIYAGFLFVTAQCNETQISKAKSALTWAVIGGVVVLGANLLIVVIQGTVDAFNAVP